MVGEAMGGGAGKVAGLLLVATGLLVGYGALTGRLAPMLAAVFRPADLSTSSGSSGSSRPPSGVGSAGKGAGAWTPPTKPGSLNPTQGGTLPPR